MNNIPTRLRRNSVIRKMVSENHINMDHIIYPVFVVEGSNIKEEIPSMKNQYHYSIDMLLSELKNFKDCGVNSLLLFGVVSDKSNDGSIASDESGIVQKAIRKIKQADPSFYLVADVCLCQYKADGHCCIYRDSEIDRIKTLEVLSSVALSYAIAGVDMVAPSDMMDGRVEKIRNDLDLAGYEYVAIMSYSVKYASNFYGPFRDAAHSAPSFGNRKSYQMDYSNSIEALKEAELDIKEGADIVMIKPAMAYLDIIKIIKQNVLVPVAAYQVSGEYAMLVNAIDKGFLSTNAIIESLIAIKRAGATIIITYFALDIKKLLQENTNEIF